MVPAVLPVRVALALALASLGCARQVEPTTVLIPPAAPPPSRPVPAAGISASEGSDSSEASPESPSGEQLMSSWSGSARGWLGVELEPVSASAAGVRVLRVVPGSPAAKAGLQTGDVVLELDGQPVSQPAEVVGIVSRGGAGKRIGVHLVRAGQDRLLAATLGAYPEGDALTRMNYVDHPAPPFEQLETAQGSVDPSLAAHAGKVVIIEFWAPWCVACRALIPHMNAWHARLGARGLRVLGITNERTARASLFARQLGMEFPILADPSGETTRSYGARAIPMVFVIDRRGTVRDVMVGYDSRKLPKLEVLVERLIAER